MQKKRSSACTAAWLWLLADKFFSQEYNRNRDHFMGGNPQEEPLAEETLKIVIPMAGLGTRLRPHTWSKPKQLMGLAGKTVLDHVIDTFSSLPKSQPIELINVVGYLGEQIEAYMGENYPNLHCHYVQQENPKGQSHAIYLARQYLSGPMLMVFADTLIETDLSFLPDESVDAIAWVKPVPDPRRFGVAEVGEDGWVKRLIEKPEDMDNNLAVVGFYYFKNSRDLIEAIEEQMKRDISLKGEYYLVDAVNILLAKGKKMRTQPVEIWLDAGTSESLLETNHYLLENGSGNCTDDCQRDSVVIVPPVFIHPTALLEKCVIGPYTSVGANCAVQNSIIRNSILEEEAQVTDMVLEDSLIGRRAQIQRRAARVNAGDQTTVNM
jgi:glucose-1-phosphate thymidylyltransferase